MYGSSLIIHRARIVANIYLLSTSLTLIITVRVVVSEDAVTTKVKEINCEIFFKIANKIPKELSVIFKKARMM